MIEDILTFPILYTFKMVFVLWSFLDPFGPSSCMTWPSIIIATPLLCILGVFAYRTLSRSSKKRHAIRIIIVGITGYWLLAGALSLPIEVVWHRLIERRYIATHDYILGFHPFTPPELMDFTLRNGTWEESDTSFFYLGPVNLQAKSKAKQLPHSLILAVWAALAAVVHTCTFLAIRLVVKRMKNALR